MLNVIKVLLFVMVNAAGFFVSSVVINLAVMMNVFPKVPQGPDMESFRTLLMAGSMWVWGASALVSVGYFFVERYTRAWLLLAPLYVPAIYTICVMLYFNFKPLLEQ